MKKQLKHSEVDTMTPVDNWQDKVKKLNDWVNENYHNVISEGVHEDIFHAIYIRFYNRLKYSHWQILEGKYNNVVFGSCFKERLYYYRTERKYVTLDFDVVHQSCNGKDNIIDLDKDKLKQCVDQLTLNQKESLREMFVYRNTVLESVEKLGLTYKQISGRQQQAFRRIAQLYNQV